MDDRYRGRLAIVTGAGDGIGAMLATGFAGWGMRVAVQDIRADAAAAVVERIGGGAFPLVYDVSDRDATMAVAEQLAAEGQVPAIVWANAGVGAGTSLLKGRPNAIEWTFGVNLFGVIWTAQAFVPLMTDGDGPRHFGVTASSAALRTPEGDFPLYATSKHTTFAIGESLMSELAGAGIESTLLCPGLLNTNIWDSAKARPDRFGGVRHQDESTAGYWREAQAPEVMWPHIERTVLAGGGHLTCDTESGEVRERFLERARRIADGVVVVR